MKRLRYLFVAVAMLCMVSLYAKNATQNWGKLPEAQMHSTSTMVGSGSTLPSAAKTGTVTTYDANSSITSTSRPRRAKMGEDDWEDDEFSETDEPWKDPIGDAMWPLAILACAYLIIRARRKRKSAMSK